MPRPQKSRRICCYPDYWSFAPDQDKANDTVTMSLDEFEAIRLIDYLGKTQEQCAAEMNVARTTVTSIYDGARKKLSQALVDGSRIVISGGNYTLDNTVSAEIARKGNGIMRIAVTYENGQIFQHFGKTPHAGGLGVPKAGFLHFVDRNEVDVNRHGLCAGSQMTVE